jgi:hypothetical protein
MAGSFRLSIGARRVAALVWLAILATSLTVLLSACGGRTDYTGAYRDPFGGASYLTLKADGTFETNIPFLTLALPGERRTYSVEAPRADPELMPGGHELWLKLGRWTSFKGYIAGDVIVIDDPSAWILVRAARSMETSSFRPGIYDKMQDMRLNPRHYASFGSARVLFASVGTYRKVSTLADPAFLETSSFMLSNGRSGRDGLWKEEGRVIYLCTAPDKPSTILESEPPMRCDGSWTPFAVVTQERLFAYNEEDAERLVYWSWGGDFVP